MIRPLSSLVLVTLLAGCASAEQNQLLGDMLSRAMQETSLSGADQGLAVKTVQVAAQGAGQASSATRSEGNGSAAAEPAADAEADW
ncbi:hypothetical protein DMO17_15420 [Aquipseudomonas alcaligenes]|uniref:Lipoprotein n=1 Tax=Aquipseudomonas alcaligenes TaxID=43263 RepID=A0A2V4KP55_AQUAC|nr:hypothetical protein [Pseudomonas alcaligenes]PYC21848.1 hypothetical protein DMO17_15420 [Pseudomonas alcaligenes]